MGDLKNGEPVSIFADSLFGSHQYCVVPGVYTSI